MIGGNFNQRFHSKSKPQCMMPPAHYTRTTTAEVCLRVNHFREVPDDVKSYH